MAAELIWTEEALDDIDDIAEFIARDSPHPSSRGDAVRSGRRSRRTAADRIVPELQQPKLRERFLYSYRLIYEIGSERIAILAVIHGRRLLESIRERFER